MKLIYKYGSSLQISKGHTMVSIMDEELTQVIIGLFRRGRKVYGRVWD
jgi:hypothetical protein